MKRTTKISHVSRHPKKRTSKAPLAIIVSAAFALGTIFLVLAALLTTAGVAAYRYYQSVVPDGIRALNSYESQPYQISLVTDRRGYTLQELADPQLGIRQVVPLSKIPSNLIWATVDTENRTFYSDPGVDPVRLLSASLHDVSGGSGLQGASTLTQQLVKLAVFGSAAGTPSVRKLDQAGIQKKLKEIMIAIGVTRDIQHCNLKCRKDAILQMYLNTVPYGGVIYGAEAASEYYFGAHVWQLDLAECALLAGLPQATSEYDPVYHRDLAIARQHEVLGFMLKQRHITQAQHDQAAAETLHFVFKSVTTRNASNTIESYFVNWLVNDYLSDPTNLAQFHIPELQQPTDIYRGFVFQTTIDPVWQQTAQSIVTQQVANLGSVNAQDGALVAIDPRSNEIKAYVGGVGYNAQINCPQCDMAWKYRQAGSSFKPFTYVTAFENGHFPGEMISDSFVQFPDSSEPGGYYTPRNYDLSYHGLVSIRKALANSYNVPAVKILDNLTPGGNSIADNIRKVIRTTNVMGYHLEVQDPSKLGLAFTLGTDRGRLLQEVNAYTVFANNGVYRPYMPILAIYRLNADGTRTLVWRYHTPKGVQVIAPQFAYLITNILSDTAAKVPAFGDFAYSYLGLPDRPVASKTGTTSDFKDNLTMGYTPDLVTGVWVGNPNNTPMYGSTGVTGAAPIWHQFMSTVLANSPPQQFIQPPGIITATVSLYAPPFSLPGLAANGYGSTDIFAAGTIPTGFDNPALDDFSGRPTAVAAPSATPAPSSQGASGANQCPGGQAPHYVTKTVNGQVVYQQTCG